MLSDDDRLAGWDTLASRYRKAAVPWLPVRLRHVAAIVGPVVGAGQAGCPRCADIRAMAAGVLGSADHDPHGKGPWLTAFAVRTLVSVVADELGRLAGGPGRRPRTCGSIIAIRLDTLRTSTHRLAADPRCPWCAVPAPEAAGELRLRPRVKASRTSSRVANLDQLGPRLLDAFVDEQVGIVQPARRYDCYGMAVASAPFGWRDRGQVDYGTGRALDHDTSRYVAVLEALERYCGMAPQRGSAVTRASFAAVRDRAVDPRLFGLYPARRYELPGFPYQPFRPDTELDWVAGCSFRRRDQVLVPASLVYYGPVPPGAGRLAYEVSNGCALGSCLEEAILHGVLEVAERDAFLMTWYGRLPAPEIDLTTARDRSLPLLAERIARLSGYTIRLFDTTLEQGIPACWAAALGDPAEPAHAAVLSAAGAHLDMERACLNALGEVATMLGTVPAKYAGQQGQVRGMVADPDLVRSMDDHGLLYCDPVAARRLGFLLGRRQRRPAPISPGPAPGWDLLDDVTLLIGRYLATGLDLIAVDQTAEELSAAGLACVKVLIPGTLPITFGHRYRRTYGLPRVRTVPHLLGYRRAPLRAGDLNPHPHPFP